MHIRFLLLQDENVSFQAGPRATRGVEIGDCFALVAGG